MTSVSRWRHYRPARIEVVGGLVALAASVVYFGALHVLDGRAGLYLEELRQSDPDRYLTVLRESRGFEAFLEEYRALADYDEFQRLPPTFLIGRWTPRPAQLRLAPGTSPEQCSDPMTLGDGMYQQLDTGGVSLPVTYRIEGQTVQMRTEDEGIMPIELVSYGGELDHIRYVPPGAEFPVYGYLCGR
ncbi:hypothetical protein SAMN04490244_106144 [Tranquillimonas rosea]|uniref:Uncharacterized protein n=1 Tax=Tranquillimonas rosea TaxID=641238 RepID=A0A1H9V138_9RHOB|nr:hypothetical protein [Tranquillimonas rosea]SES15104.1 hypothetical protein SAMN04490244_106144 [Tranquillimonas rosea]